MSEGAKSALSDANVEKYVSAVSAYEILYKHRIGKLPEYNYVAENYLDVIKAFGVYELPITAVHAHFAGKFDWSHRDPFDRLLAAQAFKDNFTLITSDPAFDTLPWLNILW
ncbi:MAG: type II toxin-antitoxin system VapC family toxin [Oscillospiraceae bacterium]|nr:type II toxin-antitoxin system VapC family toxin [Oscillospiraceae bacterium]